MTQRARWTEKELLELVKIAEFDSRNVCMNVPELAKRFGRTEKAIDYQIYKMRKQNELPPVDLTNYFDTFGRGYSENEKEQIIWMHDNGVTIQEIANSMGRTRTAMVSYLNRLFAAKKHEPRVRRWSVEDDELLIENMTFDENGYINNYSVLILLTGRTEKAINCRCVRLRKVGAIKILPNGKGSINGNEAFKELRNRDFKLAIHYKEVSRRYRERKKTNSDCNPSRQLK